MSEFSNIDRPWKSSVARHSFAMCSPAFQVPSVAFSAQENDSQLCGFMNFALG
jgi:hypothetical protein